MSIGRIEIIDGKRQYVRYATIGGSGSGGVPVGNVQELALTETKDYIALQWKDPDDIVFNGEQIAEWAGTKVVRKEGSNPESIEDGILIADSTVKNQYTVEGLQDTDVVADIQYNYALFPYTSKNVYTMSDINRVSGGLKKITPDMFDPVLENNTWGQIDIASKAGIAKEIWNLGDAKDRYIIIGFGHDDLADGTGKAGITFACNYYIASSVIPRAAWSLSSTEYVPYPQSNAHSELIKWFESGSSYMSKEIAEVIKEVSKKYALNKNAVPEVGICDCKLFLFSYIECHGLYKGDDKSMFWDYEGEKYEGIDFLGYDTSEWWTRTYAGGTDYTTCLACQNTSSSKFGIRAITKTDMRMLKFGFCI